MRLITALRAAPLALALACALLLAACGGGDPEPDCEPEPPVRENTPGRKSIPAPVPPGPART